jgi:hypothetical protein
MLLHILTLYRVEEEEDEDLVEVEAGNLREMLEKLGPNPSILPTLHNLIPNIRDKVKYLYNCALIFSTLLSCELRLYRPLDS